MLFKDIPDSPRASQHMSRTAYDGAACRAAMRGELVPSNLENHVARLALVSGIRHHVNLARSHEVGEITVLPGQELFTRARNARRIMSNSVPPAEAMSNKACYPYCIWYPDVATENTYRGLAIRCPDLRYQIGRACAVAGYYNLYRALDLLPDVSIAEEARENRGNAGAQMIFRCIMSAPVRYRVMDDATRTVHLDNPQAPAFLNADTAVVATIKSSKRRYSASFQPDSHYINITEDWGIAEADATAAPPILSAADAALLHSPLPLDLPSMNKTVLTLYAAATGNFDRYARLRRRDLQPFASRIYDVRLELICLACGCYLSSAMAAWLANSPSFLASLALHERERVMLWRAIHARRVMDDTADHLVATQVDYAGTASWVVPSAELPYWIWRPAYPPAHVLRRLAEVRPTMRPQCVRACIAADYRDLYSDIMDMEGVGGRVVPDRLMLDEARAVERGGGGYYSEDLMRRGWELGLAHLPVCKGYENWMDAASPWEREPLLSQDMRLSRDSGWELGSNAGNCEFGYGHFEGFEVSMESICYFLAKGEKYRKGKDGLGRG